MRIRYLLAASVALSLLSSAGANAQLTAHKYRLTKGDPAGPPDAPIPNDGFGGVGPTVNSGSITLGFEGISQYDVASVGRNFVPPDTIGAAGRTQYMQFVNGGVAVFDKASGARTFTSDTAFWQAAGRPGIPNGDQRVIYNAQANKWLAISFGPNTKDLLVAVSTTSNALGPWKSTVFEGFTPLANGARTLADYPTLAFDNNAVYIGTNDFGAATVGGATNFRGTTLNVIPIDSIFGKAGPTTTGNVQFRTAFTGAPTDDYSRGFAIQGVNSRENAGGTGNIIAASINDFGLTRYDVLNAGTAGAVRTVTASTTIGTAYGNNTPADQPAADAILGNVVPPGFNNPALPNGIAANRQIIDSFGDQISSSAFEVNGRIYSVHTVTNAGQSRTSVRWTILDSVTNAVLGEGNINDPTHDYYQGSLAVNALGQVVISYNRSGLNPADGRITLAARTFQTSAAGTLVATGGEIVLRVSDTDDYHNGSLYGQAASGRQRWADYSSVTTDPTSIHSFWVTGTFAREYNLAAFGHPGGTGGSRWGTYIANLNVGSVPEPTTWAMLIIGFGFVGAQARRRRVGYTTA